MPVPGSPLMPAIDHLHLFVGNALQSAYFYRSAFGFTLKAYRGPETGTQDHVSYVLEQGQIRLVLSSPLSPEHPMYGHIRTHGDSIRDVAFSVEDPSALWKTALAHGVESAYEPAALQDENGVLRMAGVHAFGDTIHSFVCRKDYQGAFRPGFFAEQAEDAASRPSGLVAVQALSAIVGDAELKRWANFYMKVLEFTPVDHTPQSSAAELRLMTGGEKPVEICLIENSSQNQARVERYVQANQGPGIETVTVTSDDLQATAARLRAQGVVLQEQTPSPQTSGRQRLVASVGDRASLCFLIA